MGLDIYLYKRTASMGDYNRRVSIQQEAEKASEAAWNEVAPGKYDDLTEEQKNAARKASRDATRKVAEKYGIAELDKYSNIPLLEEEVPEMPSAKYPEHYFKVGYFRSSYNDGGINSVMRRLGKPDLYEVMGRDKEDDYAFYPDWSASKDRALALIEDLRNMEHADIDVITISANVFLGDKGLVSNDQQALELAKEALKRTDGMRSYSNGHGTFYLDGIKLIAALPGTDDSFTKTLFGKATPCTYLVYQKEGGNDWYIQALEIVVETCDWVLAQEDPSLYFVHWSG